VILDHEEDSTFIAGAALIIVGVVTHSGFMLAFGAVLFGFAVLSQISS
jgi:hypothetical protein